MNFRFTAFLFLAVIALVVALLITNLTDAPPRPDAGLLEPLAGVKPADIDTVEIVRTEPVAETLVFAKASGRWQLAQPFPAKVDDALMDALIRDLYEAKPTTYKDLTTNLKVHGLDTPVRITLKKGDTAATVAVGDTTIGGTASAVTFLLPADRPTTPVAVRTATLRSLFRDASFGKDGTAATLTKRANDFRQLRLLSFNNALQGSDVSVLNLKRGEASVVLVRKPDGGWRFTAPPRYGDADPLGDTKANADLLTGVLPLLQALDGFRPAAREDYIEQVPPADLIKYGLAAGDPNVIRVELTPKSGPVEVLYIGKAVETNGVPAVPAKVYCRLEGDPAVVPVTTDRAKILAATIGNPSLMRNRDLIPDTRKPRIDAIDLTVRGETFRLRKVGTAPDLKWAVYGGPSGPTEALPAAVIALLDAACAPRAAADVLPAPNDAAFAPAAVSGTLKVYFDGIAAPAPLLAGNIPPEPAVAEKESAPAVTLTFGQPTTTALHVRRVIGTAPPTDFLVATPKEAATTLVSLAARPRLEYLNPNVGSFVPDSVAQVQVRRGAETVSDLAFTDREWLTEPEKSWFPAGKWVSGGKPASATAVQQILLLLAGLGQSKLIAEAPPDTDLTAWGLKPARLTVKVALKSDPAKPKVYEFGNEIPNAGKVYLRVDGKLFVLAAEKFVVQSVESADLRDPVVHRVARAAISRVDLSWRADTGQIDSLFVAPDPAAKWAATDPKDFKLDADKTEALVSALELPAGGTFVAGPEKPEYKLTGDVLRVLLHRGQPGPVEFILGAEDETKQFVYAKSSDTAGVIKLPAAPFRPFLVGRKALGK